MIAYEEKVAVVTGAGGTLCSAIAIDLAKKGAMVVLVGRTREKLEKVAAQIAAAKGVCRIEPGDVTDEAAVADIAVMRSAEARRMASIMMKSSISASSGERHVDWITKTSQPRMLSRIWTNFSPSGKRVMSMPSSGLPM